MKDILIVLVNVLGGLGIFLLGMKHLSEGLQAVSGSGLRKFMGLATTHRMAGVGTGIVSTIIVQSSSIISVMLVGFVSSGLMTLSQSINVLIGANIGTTATVWMMAFAPDPEMLALTGITIGGFLYFFIHREKLHNLGLAILGFGLVFLGMYFMKEGVGPIKSNEAIRAGLMSLDAKSFLGVAEVALISAVFTAVIQSSAASILIFMTLASQGLISYEMAIASLFGANIGTTMTGWLAAIGGTSEAKRTAMAHTLSNAIGSIVFLPFVLPVLVPVGKHIFASALVSSVDPATGLAVFPKIMIPIAVTDTTFSILRGIITYPFVEPFAKLLMKLIPGSAEEKPHLSCLKIGAPISPVIACDQALQEVVFMRESDVDLIGSLRTLLIGEGDDAIEHHISHREDILDNVQREVTEFLGSIMSKRLAQDVAERAQRLIRITDELESVSDEAAAVLKAMKRLRKHNQKMSEVSNQLLLSVHDKVAAFAFKITPWIRSPRPAINVTEVQNESRNLHEFLRDCRKVQLGRVGSDDPESSIRVLAELDMINAYERIRSYYLNIAEVLAGGKRAN